MKSVDYQVIESALQHKLVPDSLLIHRGIFSNDLDSYYIVTSNKSFQNFDIKVSKNEAEGWREMKEVWFNSEYDDHGLSFSPNGLTLVFSSTRPTGHDEIPSTWHLWQSRYQNGSWTEPEFIDIPNLRDKLVSHPTLSPDGTMYYHVSNLDYTEMGIYFSVPESGRYSDGMKLSIAGLENGTCTPYITSDGKFLFFAAIEETLPIYYIERTKSEWSLPKRLPKHINIRSQANPFLTPDNQYLLFASEKEDQDNWEITKVSTSSFMK